MNKQGNNNNIKFWKLLRPLELNTEFHYNFPFPISSCLLSVFSSCILYAIPVVRVRNSTPTTPVILDADHVRVPLPSGLQRLLDYRIIGVHSGTLNITKRDLFVHIWGGYVVDLFAGEIWKRWCCTLGGFPFYNSERDCFLKCWKNYYIIY